MRQAHDLASRSEDIDAIREEVDLDVFKELTAISTGTLNFHQTLQPGFHHVLDAAGIHAVVVDPVRKNAHLVNAVHFFRTNLVLNRSAVGTDDGGVKTSVSVSFRYSNEVFEAVVHRLIELVQGAQSEVALFARTNDYTKAVDVQNIREGSMRVTHAVVYTVDGLISSLDLRHNTAFG